MVVPRRGAAAAWLLCTLAALAAAARLAAAQPTGAAWGVCGGLNGPSAKDEAAAPCPERFACVRQDQWVAQGAGGPGRARQGNAGLAAAVLATTAVPHRSRPVCKDGSSGPAVPTVLIAVTDPIVALSPLPPPRYYWQCKSFKSLPRDVARQHAKTTDAWAQCGGVSGNPDGADAEWPHLVCPAGYECVRQDQ
jgi:hypothetical protein